MARRMAIDSPEFTGIQMRMFTSMAKRQLYIGAQRSGKTFEFTRELVDVALRLPGARCYYVGPNFPVMRPIMEQLTNYMSQIGVLVNHNSQEHVWITPSNGMIQFKTGEKPESIKGWDCDLVILDEASLCPETAFVNCQIACNVRNGTLKLGTNVPEPSHPGYDWIYRVYRDWSKDPEAEVAVFPAWANSMVYPLGRDDPKIKALENSLARDVFARRIGGDLRVLTGLIYHEFDPVKHVVSDYKPDNCLIAIDPAYSSAAAVLFCDYDGRVLTVYDEVYGDSYTQADIVAICEQSDIAPALVVVDSEAPELVEELIRHGLPAVSSPDKNVHKGIMTVKNWLDHDRIRIDESCEKTLWEIKRYMFGKNERPLKINDHAMDALRYLVTAMAKAEAEAQLLEEPTEELAVMGPDPEIDAMFGADYVA